jgi:GTP cyclohydrolase I
MTQRSRAASPTRGQTPRTAKLSSVTHFDDDDAPASAGHPAEDGSHHKKHEKVDRPRIEAAVREILLAIGEDPDRGGLLDTPKRVAKAYAEVFSGLHLDPADVLSTTFDLDHEELVLVKDIPFYSTCEHHLVPFHGVAHVGYIPSHDGKVTGLSKLARLVDIYALRPQVQERLTTQIVEAMVSHLKPRGAIVVVECEHMCMSMRGVRKPGAKTVTSAVRGQLHDPATRAEAMSLILGR